MAVRRHRPSAQFYHHDFQRGTQCENSFQHVPFAPNAGGTSTVSLCVIENSFAIAQFLSLGYLGALLTAATFLDRYMAMEARFMLISGSIQARATRLRTALARRGSGDPTWPGCHDEKNTTVHAQVCSTSFSRKMAVLHAKSEVCANRNRLCPPSTIPPQGGTANGSHCERI